MRHLWEYKALLHINYRLICTIFCLMGISLLIISSMTMEEEGAFMTRYVYHQIRWFFLGWIAFGFSAGINYQRLREWTWPIYLVFVALLVGLFFVPAIQNVHRWYRLPGVGISIQPSEYAKLVIVFTLAWFMERKQGVIGSFPVFCGMLLIVGIPFCLILKQPDLGTALVLYPIALVMSYIAGMHTKALYTLGSIGAIGVCTCVLIFSGFLSHSDVKPFAMKFLKEYQYARLDPDTYHQRSAKIAVAIGGVSGSGFRQSSFSSQKWLPAAHTDSVFAAYAEEFGFIGVAVLFSLFYSLIYFGFQVATAAKDAYGSFLAAGITVYLAMHILMNISMMLGLIPITGVPLLLVTYGGSSVLTTMAALGFLQSIHSRRLMFY